MSNQTKHTPGPWFMNPAGFYNETVYARDERGGDWWTICHAVDPLDDIKTRQANARLISASPDLLAACKEGLQFTKNDTESAELHAMFSAAIAKAEGRQT